MANTQQATADAMASAKPRIDHASIVVGVLILGALVASMVWAGTWLADDVTAANEEQKQLIITEISETLNVEILRMSDRVGIDIKDADGKTFNCDYPVNFDGHLYGCEETNVIG